MNEFLNLLVFTKITGNRRAEGMFRIGLYVIEKQLS